MSGTHASYTKVIHDKFEIRTLKINDTRTTTKKFILRDVLFTEIKNLGQWLRLVIIIRKFCMTNNLVCYFRCVYFIRNALSWCMWVINI